MLMHEGLLITNLSLLLIGIILALIIEKYRHDFFLKQIPTRISVTGSRGKTSTVRYLASILRASGFSVLAKTTGSEASYILPDGQVEIIQRKGIPNILEQKKVIRKAAQLNVDFVISEVMSIQPENHWVESQRLLKPDFTIITNLRPDHLDHYEDHAMVRMIENDLVRGTTIILPANELNHDLLDLCRSQDISQITCESDNSFRQNQILAACLAKSLGISSDIIEQGIHDAEMDRGRVEEFHLHAGDLPIIFVSAFAANDPLTSEAVIEKVRAKYPVNEYDMFGFFTFRDDRGERTKQWENHLKQGGSKEFDTMFFHGMHRHAIQRSLGDGYTIGTKAAEKITTEIIRHCAKATVVLGLGNIHGTGTELINYWKGIADKTECLDLD